MMKNETCENGPVSKKRDLLQDLQPKFDSCAGFDVAPLSDAGLIQRSYYEIAALLARVEGLELDKVDDKGSIEWCLFRIKDLEVVAEWKDKFANMGQEVDCKVLDIERYRARIEELDRWKEGALIETEQANVQTEVFVNRIASLEKDVKDHVEEQRI